MMMSLVGLFLPLAMSAASAQETPPAPDEQRSEPGELIGPGFLPADSAPPCAMAFATQASSSSAPTDPRLAAAARQAQEAARRAQEAARLAQEAARRASAEAARRGSAPARPAVAPPRPAPRPVAGPAPRPMPRPAAPARAVSSRPQPAQSTGNTRSYLMRDYPEALRANEILADAYSKTAYRNYSIVREALNRSEILEPAPGLDFRHCLDNPGVLAFTHAGQPRIYLCRALLDRKRSYTPSYYETYVAEVLIHESVHVAGTRDECFTTRLQYSAMNESVGRIYVPTAYAQPSQCNIAADFKFSDAPK